MKALEVARLLRCGGDSSQAASRFLEGLRSVRCQAPSAGGGGCLGGVRVGIFKFEDAASLALRFARHAPPPPRRFFEEVASCLEAPLRQAAAERPLALPVSLSRDEEEEPMLATGTSAVVLADAFARTRCHEGIKVLGLVCLSAAPNLSISPVEVLQLIESLSLLGPQAFRDPAVRSFLLMRLQEASSQMDACSLAQCGRHLAEAGLYSPELSEEIAQHLAANPWCFTPGELQDLLPHFQIWKLGELHKKAFHSLGRRISEHAELLSPVQALRVIETFTDIGSVHEVALQTLFLRLLLERSFTELPEDGIARLAASMSKVQHYHTGLLREIIIHIREEPEVLAAWGPEQLSGLLRSLGLAPVRVPAPTQIMLGCRYTALLPDMTNKDLKEFFEVCGWHPDLLRRVLGTRAARGLPRSLAAAAREWGPRACSDAALALTLAADTSLAKAFTFGCQGCSCQAGASSAQRRRTQFRSEQPASQLQVILRAARTYKDPGLRQTVARPEMPLKRSAKHLYLAGEEAPQKLLQGSGKCQALWALPVRGRRSQQRELPGQFLQVAAAILSEVLPTLLGRLRDGSNALSELPGASLIPALLGEPAPLESIGGPLPPPAVIPAEDQVLLGERQLQLPLDDAEMPEPGQHRAAPTSTPWWEKISEPSIADGPPETEFDERELESMRRSEILEVCVQSLAVMQLCFSAGPSTHLFSVLPLHTLKTMAAMLPMVNFLLRPRREDDAVAQRYHLGPQRLEAFVRRPDEHMQKEVYKTTQDLIPIIPGLLGWRYWPRRKRDTVQGEETGGALLSLQRDLEVPPFVVCIVLRPKKPHYTQQSADGSFWTSSHSETSSSPEKDHG
ncbi:esyt3 [Symbiodinium sp. CCMP2592]|nr:esyt3 [Symbiodinium sp. CCMP2592]